MSVPTETSVFFDIVTIFVALLVMGIPGLLTGFAAGLRGWALAGLTPLLSYAIGGLSGPWAAAIGIPFNPVTYLVVTVLFVGVAYGLRRFTVRRWAPEPEPGLWARKGHLAVGACLLVATAAGMYAVIDGMGSLDVISQGFDAPYHANAIRYIADTGDGGLFGTSQVNWYNGALPVFYPNAYHLLGSVTHLLSGASVPLTMNVNTALLPGLLALSLVTVIREFRGRAVLAGAVALTAVAPAIGLYDSMSRGPLLPFLLGLALTPVAVVAARRYLDRPAPDTGFILLAAALGLLCVHSSTLFGGILFSAPMLLQRWVTGDARLRRLGRDLLALLPIAVLAVPVAWLQLFGALGLAAGDVPYYGWPIEYRATTAVGSLLGFQHFGPYPQVWLSAALFLGLVFFSRLRALKWVGGTALVTGLLYAAVASSDNPLLMAISRPWWDDPYRFVAMATVPLSVLAGHGLAESQAWLRDKLPRVPAVVVAIVVLLAFTGLSGGLYASSNATHVAPGYGDTAETNRHEIPVTPDEAAAMLELGKLAKPGEWAMNDRRDGTVWTYSVSGVRTVAGHFDQTFPPKDALTLATKFRDYDSDAEVRAAVKRLNIHWLIIRRPGSPKNAEREVGLQNLDGLPFLTQVYQNPDALIYRVNV
ncbi:DUF6541 family protein [Amycolatopsis sp. H20-H5]|uniref:DUF6541 family protein n=1 Tax=Amycolatopsis sp. H20-H5 TaxID=3046309 RepID=UPI002DB602C6|nr:DUF6541 family protein [Amycolatopsis sp. H20-H5]MEC3980545.1 DUF6541 family protein [Amycolatopsis sp. H20-H5]